jgi:hypothetical protein
VKQQEIAPLLGLYTEVNLIADLELKQNWFHSTWLEERLLSIIHHLAAHERLYLAFDERGEMSRIDPEGKADLRDVPTGTKPITDALLSGWKDGLENLAISINSLRALAQQMSTQFFNDRGILLKGSEDALSRQWTMLEEMIGYFNKLSCSLAECKYPTAKPGALVCEPLKAARRGR